jgi:general secretion pathway protein B
MSYILEALRRAESERERKRGVPGLHAQPVPTSAADDGRSPRFKPWWWVVIGLGAGVLLMGLWRAWPSDAADEALARAPVAGNVISQSTPQATTGATPAVPPAAAAPSPAVADAPARPPAGSTEPPAPPTPSAAAQPAPEPRSKAAPRPPKTAARAEPKPAPRNEPVGAPPAAPPAAAAPNTPNTTAPRTPAPAPAPPPPRPAERLRSLTELPDELRRSVPALSFGGSVYSDIPTQRMVIFNGQVFREGDALGDDLMLEQIRPRSAVMRLRGERFEVAF